MHQDFIPIPGVLYLFGIKSLIRFSYSFQTNHHLITITIQCFSSTTTTTRSTTTTDVITTVTLCQCQLLPRLLLSLLMQAINNNWHMWPPMRLNDMNRIRGWLRVSLVLCASLFHRPHCLCQCCHQQQLLFRSQERLQIKQVVSPLY